MGHWPIWTRQVGHRPLPPAQTVMGDISQTRIRQCPCTDIPDVREDVVAPEHQNHALNTDYREIEGLSRTRRWFTRVRLMNSSITATESYLTARWSSAWDVNTPVHQTVAVVNYPNEHLYTRVTEFKYLTGQEHAKLASSTSTRESEIHTTPCTASRERRTLQEIQGAGWCSARREFRRAASNTSITTWTRWWLRLWRCRLQVCDNWDLQENVDQKLCQSSVAKTFEDKILIVLNMKGIVSNRFSTTQAY